MKKQSNEFLDEIYQLADELIFNVNQIQFSHFRLSKQSVKVDIFVKSRKFHVLASGERGVVVNPKEFLTLYFGNNPSEVMDILISERKRKIQQRKREIEGMDLNSIMPFGEYVGKKIKYVPVPYLKFIYENEYCSLSFMKFLKANFNFE